MDELFSFFTAAMCVFCISFVLYKILWKWICKIIDDLCYVIRRIVVKREIKKTLKYCMERIDENVQGLDKQGLRDEHNFYGLDSKRNRLVVKFRINADRTSEIDIFVILQNGIEYFMPQQMMQQSSVSSWMWRNKNLRLDVLEPFKRIRVCYNGLLSDAHQRLHHVTFSLVWSSVAPPFYFPYDTDFDLLLGETLACDFMSACGYEQFGAIHGEIRGEIFPPEGHFIHLPCLRVRSRTAGQSNDVHLFAAGHNGLLFSVNSKTDTNGSRMQYGHMITSDYTSHTLTASDLSSVILPASGAFTCHFMAGGKTYKCVFHSLGNEHMTISRDSVSTMSAGPCQIGTKLGVAILDSERQQDNRDRFDTLTLISDSGQLPNRSQISDWILDLDDAEACDASLTGGKASSLAVLRSLRSNGNFDVPSGFVITVNAYDAHVRGSVLEDALDELTAVFCQRHPGNCEHACAKTVQLFTISQLSEELIDQVGNRLTTGRWAVRSSSVCEDGVEISAAGQNETFLGLSSELDLVMRKIVECWSSLFTYHSVQYRHRHGLPIKTQMAVVVQRMVDAESAGVLFTANPVSGNPAQSVITANHGLGESVVSGHADPDTIIVEQNRIISQTIGKKHTVIKLSALQEGGVEELVNQNPSVSCVSSQQALLLAQIGKWLDSNFTQSRFYYTTAAFAHSDAGLDIEWAFTSTNRLFLLQARPITTLNGWSETQLWNEFDTPILCDQVAFTVANTGEVFPGATTLLTQTTVLNMLDKALQKRLFGTANLYINKCLTTFGHSAFLDVITSLHKNAEETIPPQADYVDLAVFGHPVINDRLNNMAAERFGYITPTNKLLELVTMIKFAYRNDTLLSKAQRTAREASIELDGTSEPIASMYKKIDDFLPIMHDVFYCHCISSGVSVFYQMLALMILGRGQKLTMDVYNDVAAILSSCENVTGAEIPELLSRIVQQLEKEGLVDEFVRSDDDDARVLLNERSQMGTKLFKQFLEKHGHRSLGEFDLANPSWSKNPSEVIRMIKSNCQTVTTAANRRSAKTTKGIREVVESLKTVQSGIARTILTFLVKKIRKTVGMREQTKSEVIRMVDKLRQAYTILAQKMQLEGIIPDHNLIFHFSHSEVRSLIENQHNSPATITKALLRQRLYPKWNRNIYTEVSHGIPLPNINVAIATSCDHGEIAMKGTPVCNGVVEARACVITSLDEIAQLKNGDILITYCTDIGWSPYFPMLSGIVTELGGLVSHGAVIAREYGLPSIVGVCDVTRIFKTGDYVLLSGNTGDISLISRQV